MILLQAWFAPQSKILQTPLYEMYAIFTTYNTVSYFKIVQFQIAPNYIF